MHGCGVRLDTVKILADMVLLKQWLHNQLGFQHNQHCIIVCIYNVFTINQMWYKCFSKYGICDINTIVNIKDSFTVAEMSHIQIYLHICTIFE